MKLVLRNLPKIQPQVSPYLRIKNKYLKSQFKDLDTSLSGSDAEIPEAEIERAAEE